MSDMRKNHSWHARVRYPDPITDCVAMKSVVDVDQVPRNVNVNWAQLNYTSYGLESQDFFSFF